MSGLLQRERERERERERVWVEWFRISATPINRPSLTGANKAARTDMGQQSDRVVRIIAER